MATGYWPLAGKYANQHTGSMFGGLPKADFPFFPKPVSYVGHVWERGAGLHPGAKCVTTITPWGHPQV